MVSGTILLILGMFLLAFPVVRSTVEEKMDKYDPAKKHPKNWLAFLLCSHPINRITGRRLS